MAKTGPSGKRGRESGGLDHAPAHKAPVRAQKNHGNGIKRCKTSDVASEALCKIKISSILEEFGCLGSLGLEINPGPSLASAQRDPVHAVPKDEKKAYKRAPPAKQICCKCATVRAAPAGCKSGINFCCRDSVGKHACAIKCIWTGCKRNICGSIIDSMDQFRSGLGAHAKECSCKHPALTAVAQRLINLSIRLPFSAVRDADEQVWVQFAEDCLKCRAPEGMGDLIRRLYDQIKPTTLHPAWVESESTHFVRETFRVKTASNAALLVLRLEYGAVHWGRVDRSFHVERAAETLSGLRQTIQDRMLSDEAVTGKALTNEEDLIGCTKITTTPVGQTVTTTPTTAATPTNSKVTPVPTSSARGRGAFSMGGAPTAPSKAFSAEACSEGLEGCDELQKVVRAHKMKPVCQLNVESRRPVQCHPSISDAAIAAGVGKSQMYKAIRLQSRLKGFLWQYMPADSPSHSKIPSLASCGEASQDSHGSSGGVGMISTCGHAAGRSE